MMKRAGWELAHYQYNGIRKPYLFSSTVYRMEILEYFAKLEQTISMEPSSTDDHVYIYFQDGSYAHLKPLWANEGLEGIDKQINFKWSLE